jgi:hypothetical protein
MVLTEFKVNVVGKTGSEKEEVLISQRIPISILRYFGLRQIKTNAS